MSQEKVQDPLLHVENKAVVHIANSFVTASRPMMAELHLLNGVLDRLNLRIRAEWIPSAVNRYADALSRRLPRGELHIRQLLRRSVADGMRAPVDALKFRPLGEHPVAQRKVLMQELEVDWSKDGVRLLCPPVDLIQATVNKINPHQGTSHPPNHGLDTSVLERSSASAINQDTPTADAAGGGLDRPEGPQPAMAGTGAADQRLTLAAGASAAIAGIEEPTQAAQHTA